MAISPQQLTIYLYSAHRAVIFAIAQLSCFYYGGPQVPILSKAANVTTPTPQSYHPDTTTKRLWLALVGYRILRRIYFFQFLTNHSEVWRKARKVSVGARLVNGRPIKCRVMPPCYAGLYSQVQLCASSWHAMGNAEHRRGESG